MEMVKGSGSQRILYDLSPHIYDSPRSWSDMYTTFVKNIVLKIKTV